MSGMASTVSVLCVRPSLLVCHVCFLEKKKPVFCFNLVSSSAMLIFLLLEISLVCFKLF